MIIGNTAEHVRNRISHPDSDPLVIPRDTIPRLVKGTLILKGFANTTWWRMELGSQVLYLTLPGKLGEPAELSPEAPRLNDSNGAPVPMPKQDFLSRRTRQREAGPGGIPTLSMVVTQRDIPFAPRDSAGLPRLVCLRLGTDDSTSSIDRDRSARPVHILSYTAQGQVAITQASIDMEALCGRKGAAAEKAIKSLLVVALPLDIATGIALAPWQSIDLVEAGKVAGIVLAGCVALGIGAVAGGK